MTDNRMEAQPIAGAHGRFCGAPSAPFVKTPCCQQWIGCDTAFVSCRGGGRCQVEHERFRFCLTFPFHDLRLYSCDTLLSTP